MDIRLTSNWFSVPDDLS